MTFPKTGGSEWGAAQASPQVPVNGSLRRLDALASRAIIADRDLAAPPVSCADGANYLVAAAPTGLWAGQVGKLATAVGANAANGWNFQTVTVEGYQLYVQDENVEIQYDGAAWISVATATNIRPIGFFFTTAPTASETLLLYTVIESITLADEFAGSAGDVGTNPAAAFVLDVHKNGASVGSITISTAGVFTFVTTGTTVPLVAGDQVKIIAPAVVDAAVANVSITLKGTL